MGRDALLKERNEGPPVQLKALLIQDKRIARQGYEIATLDKQIVGKITSGTFSPHCSLPIALGFLHKDNSQSTDYLIKVRNDWIPAKITSLPFVPSRVRKNPK